MPVIQWADAPGFSQLPQPIDGKSKIGVLPDAGVIKSFAAVGLNQCRRTDIHGDFAETGVTAANGLVERFLIQSDDSGTRYQYQAAVTQWLFQWCPRHRLNAPPAVGFQKQLILQREFTQIAQNILAPPFPPF